MFSCLPRQHFFFEKLLGSIFNGGGFGQARTGTEGISGFGNGRSCEEREAENSVESKDRL